MSYLNIEFQFKQDSVEDFSFNKSLEIPNYYLWFYVFIYIFII